MAPATEGDLLSLPCEIQLQILEYTVAAGFENLVLACKALYSLAVGTPLDKHNEMRRKYGAIRFSSGWDNADESLPYSWGNTVAEVLYHIAREPVIASYVRDVDLATRSGLSMPRIFVRGDSSKPTEAEDLVRRLLQASPYLRQLDASPDFINHWLQRIIPYGDRSEVGSRGVDYATLFLLTLLPNLERLTLGSQWSLDGFGYAVHTFAAMPAGSPDWDEVPECTSRFIQMLIERANDETLAGQSLSKLTTLRPTSTAHRLVPTDIRAVVPFLALRSLQEFRHTGGRCEVETDVHYDKDYNERDYSDKDWARRVGGADEADECEDDDDSEYVQDSAEERYEKSNHAEKDDNEVNQDDDDDENEDDDDYEADDSSWDEEIIKPQRQRRPVPRFHDHGQLIDRRYPVLGTNVEFLELSNCVIDTVACRALLRGMHKLKRLSIRYFTRYSLNLNWDVQSCLMVLTQLLGPVLETLVLDAGKIEPANDLIRLSMHEFTALKYLVLNSVLFTGRATDQPGEPISPVSMSGPIEPLQYILPPSLETFVLYVWLGDDFALPQLFDGFVDERAEKLPSLKSVTLRIRPRPIWSCDLWQVEEFTNNIHKLASAHGLHVEPEGDIEFWGGRCDV